MPELPEVEVTRRAIAQVALGHVIDEAIVRVPRLRWDVPVDLARILAGRRVASVARRGKYLLVECTHTQRAPGWLLVHLGMSGSFTVVAADTPLRKHDHADLRLGDRVLRYHDPRRFGSIDWLPVATLVECEAHPLLAGLGVEPLSEQFTAELLWQRTRGRRVAIKQALLAGNIVVGVGNIYCSEALFRAGIHPAMQAQRLSRERAVRLVAAVRETLTEAIAAGGSSLRDFVSGEQEMGYFQVNARVYDRAGQPCRGCGNTIRKLLQGQRATYYCSVCQKR